MSKQIWVRKGPEVRGPYSVAQVRQLADEGKLTPLHEISSDQIRWKPAGEVAGLGIAGQNGPANAHRAGGESVEGLSALAGSQGGLFAMGVMLLVVVTLIATGAFLLKLGLLNGGVIALLFLLTLGLGYPAVCLGRDVSVIYVLLMAVVCVMLLGESPVRFGTTLVSWLGFTAGLIPGLLIVAGWTLVTRGLGHDNEIAEMARLNPSRFLSAPLSKKESKQAAIAAGGGQASESPGRVRLRLDPDDLDGVEESLGDVIEQEARRGAPGMAISFVLHAVLLLALAVLQLRISRDSDLVIELSWKTGPPPAQTVVVSPQDRNLKLQAVKINQQKPPQPEEKPLQPQDPGPRTLIPVKPAKVGGLFDGRSEENRRRILDQEVKNGPRIEQAISQGLSWLRRHQQSAGNWRLHTGYKNASDWPQLKTDTGATALALLAFLGDGQTHKQAKDKATQEAIQKGLDWLIGVQNQNANGDFHDLSSEQGRQPAFYAQSQATIVMCEAYAMTKDRALYEPALRGVEYLLKSQQPNEGGWRYQPLNTRAVGDLSVTGWALMALHSARAAGISVPEEPFQRASKFLDSVEEQDGARYRYQPTGWSVTRSMTAEGLLCRQFLGWPRTQPQLRDGLEFLLDEKYQPSWSEGRRDVYEWYYVGHLLHNMNDEEWTDWYAVVQQELVDNQLKAGDSRGSWHPHQPRGAPYEHADKAGRLYITAMCLLILEMPIRHQPIYGD